eukprot:2455607-Pyramimonas_sp.AAC.1
MTETIEEHKKTTQKTSFTGKAVWLDQESLEAKYKNRPQQLASIQKTARKMWAAARNTWLWEDFECETSYSNEAEFSASHKRVATTECEIKAAKRPKGTGRGKGARAGAGDAEGVAGGAEGAAQRGPPLEKSIPEGQVKRLKKLLDEISAKRLELASSLTACKSEEMKEYVTIKVLQVCDKITASSGIWEGRVKTVLEKGTAPKGL